MTSRRQTPGRASTGELDAGSRGRAIDPAGQNWRPSQRIPRWLMPHGLALRVTRVRYRERYVAFGCRFMPLATIRSGPEHLPCPAVWAES
jgi:hypothetical protein